MTSRSEKKAKHKAEKRRRFYRHLRRYAHNILTLAINLGLMVFAYLLLYGLIFEPLLISKSYGASDTREFLYLATVGFLVGVFYFLRYLINFTEEQAWQRNWRLLRDVDFDLARYTTLKQIGISKVGSRKKRHSSTRGKSE
jgi:hypothetical protein